MLQLQMHEYSSPFFPWCRSPQSQPPDQRWTLRAPSLHRKSAWCPPDVSISPKGKQHLYLINMDPNKYILVHLKHLFFYLNFIFNIGENKLHVVQASHQAHTKGHLDINALTFILSNWLSCSLPVADQSSAEKNDMSLNWLVHTDSHWVNSKVDLNKPARQNEEANKTQSALWEKGRISGRLTRRKRKVCQNRRFDQQQHINPL